MNRNDIVHLGWGCCFNCRERYRSIALIDAIRLLIEERSDHHEKCNAGYGAATQHRSLLGEAERSLRIAKNVSDDDDQHVSEPGSGQQSRKLMAIHEFTHAINAVNYLTSISNGQYLILRAEDILLISHSLRAELEGNVELQDAILEAFPRATVRISRSSEIKDGRDNIDSNSYGISKAGFEAPFYLLPAVYMCPADGGLIQFDSRTKTHEMCKNDPHLQEHAALTTNDDVAMHYRPFNTKTRYFLP